MVALNLEVSIFLKWWLFPVLGCSWGSFGDPSSPEITYGPLIECSFRDKAGYQSSAVGINMDCGEPEERTGSKPRGPGSLHL